MWWHFQVGWASGLQFVFFWNNLNSQKCVWIVLLKMTFWISQGKVATSDRWCGQILRFSCQIFSGFNVPKSLKSVNFWQRYSKIKVDVFGDTVYLSRVYRHKVLGRITELTNAICYICHDVSWSAVSDLCVCFRHGRAGALQKGWTDLDAAWRADYYGRSKSCIRWRCTFAPFGKYDWCGGSDATKCYC